MMGDITHHALRLTIETQTASRFSFCRAIQKSSQYDDNFWEHLCSTDIQSKQTLHKMQGKGNRPVALKLRVEVKFLYGRYLFMTSNTSPYLLPLMVVSRACFGET